MIDNSEGDEGEDSDQWYLGSVPTFGPNTAYSLYGVLKTDIWDRGCSKRSYINSFQTTEGLKSFTDSLNLAGVSSVYVSKTDNGDGDDDGNSNQYTYTNTAANAVSTDCVAAASGSDSSGGAYWYSLSSTSRSKSIACGEGDTYVSAELFGAYCEGEIYKEYNALSGFNRDMKNTDCVEIYNAKTYSTEWAAVEDDDDGDEEDEHHSSNDESDALLGPLYLLQSSKTCSFRDSYCPDPYGKLKKYTMALERATGSLNAAYAEEEEVMRKAEAMTTAGIVLLLAATCLVGYEVFQEFSGVKPPRRSGKGGIRKRARRLLSKRGSKKKAPKEENVLPMPTIDVTGQRSRDAGSIASVGSFGGQSVLSAGSKVSVGSKKATWYPISLPQTPLDSKDNVEVEY